MITELDDGRRTEHAVLVDDKLTMFERVDVRLDQEQVGAALDRQEAASWDVDTMGVLEVLDGSTSSGLELDDGGTIFSDLRIDDNLKLHALCLHDALESCGNTQALVRQPVRHVHLQKSNQRTLEVDPDVVGVEDLELSDGLEVFHVFGRNLGDLKQLDATIVVDDSTTLHVRLGLVSDLHDELGASINHVLEDTLINASNKTPSEIDTI